MPISKTEIGNRIKQRLKELNMNQKILIEMTEMKQSTISGYMTGVREPKIEQLYIISRALKTDLEWLCTGEKNAIAVNFYSDEEKEIINNFRELPLEEKLYFKGLLEGKADTYKKIRKDKKIEKVENLSG